jgi:hypothetical protein
VLQSSALQSGTFALAILNAALVQYMRSGCVQPISLSTVSFSVLQRVHIVPLWKQCVATPVGTPR